ncbi:MAG: TolC family protein [Muribaculaceae bacterium]
MSNRKLLVTPIFILAASIVGVLHARNENLTMSLDQLYQIAENNNTSIRAFDVAVREAQQAVAAAKADRLPDLKASLSFSYLGNGYITDRDFTNGTAVHIPHYGNNFALQAVWAVYTGGAVTAAIDISRLGEKMAKYDAAENRQNVRFIITAYYLNIHALQNQVKVIDENIALNDSLIALTRSRLSQGMALQNDITRYELQAEKMKLTKTQAINKTKILNHQLLTALGIEDGINILTEEDFILDQAEPHTEDFWQSTATACAPALRKSALAVQISSQKEKLEKSERLPKIALFAEDHLDGPITFEIPNLDNNIHFWYVGVSISYNIASLYKNNKKIRQAQIASRLAGERHTDLAEKTENSIQAAYTDYLTSLSELETNTKSVELATQNYDIIYSRYTNGMALVTDMTDAANQRLDAQIALVNSKINILYNYFNLKHLSGTL